MRERLRTLLPTVLAASFATLLAVPALTTATSDLPATISVYPGTIGPGSTVDVTGIGFPSERAVELELTTNAGALAVGTATTDMVGDFRFIVTLPADLPTGAWELAATTANGVRSTFTIDAVSAESAVAALVDEAAAATPAATAGNAAADSAFLLVIGVVLGAIAVGVLFVYRQVREESQPGMGRAADLIWGGSESLDGAPELTATDRPHWMAAASET